MPIKRIHILANSIKNQGRCIAGRELIRAGGEYRLGDWIRPVGSHGEGELFPEDCRTTDNQAINVFDVFDVSLQRQAGSASQPENWLLDPRLAWRKVRIESNLPSLCLETPNALWPELPGRKDRISPQALAKLKCGRSLYLISVKRFRIQLGWREIEGAVRLRRRAAFEYRGVKYNFSLTDPVATEKYCRSLPGRKDGPKSICLPGGDECKLCVSLTPPFNGYHFKIVATVIESQ